MAILRERAAPRGPDQSGAGPGGRRARGARTVASSKAAATAGESTPGRASVTISPEGRYLDASPAALELFGVDLDEVRMVDVGTFVQEPFGDAARESWRVWVESGLLVARGEREVVRPDGRRCRIRFEAVRDPDGSYQETMQELAGNSERRSAFTTLAAVLEAVREAERALAKLPKRSPRRRLIKAEIGQLREAFEQMVRSRMWSP